MTSRGATAGRVVSEAGCRLPRARSRSVRRWLATWPSGSAAASPAAVGRRAAPVDVPRHGHLRLSLDESTDEGLRPAVVADVAGARSCGVRAWLSGRCFRPARRRGIVAMDARAREAGHRNQVWEVIRSNLDALVAPPACEAGRCGYGRPCSSTGPPRVIVGWAIPPRPSTAQRAAALRDGTPVACGTRRSGYSREALERRRPRVCAEDGPYAVVALDIEFNLASTYAPEEKGKIERLHCTCVETL